MASYLYEIRGQARSGSNHVAWNKIRQENGLLQKKLAKDLVRHLRIEVPQNGCGLNEIHEFQSYFARKGTAIVINNYRDFGTGRPCLFDGTEITIRVFGRVIYFIRVMFFEEIRHFRPILNMRATAGSRNFCIPCNVSYNNDRNHRCNKRCMKFLQNLNCDKSLPLRHCQQCSHDFFGDVCFFNHLQVKSYSKNLSVCHGAYVCSRCQKTVRVIKKKN